MEYKLNKLRVQGARKTVYDEGDKFVCVYKKETSFLNILSECVRQTRAYELGYNVPKIIDLEKIDDCWAVITTRFEGRSIYSIMKEEPEKIMYCLDRLLQAQQDMHKIESRQFRKIEDKIADKMTEIGASAVELCYLHRYLSSLPKKDILCHCDLNPLHLHLLDDGSYIVADWVYTAEGDPEADIAISFLEIYLQFGEEIANKYINLYYSNYGGNKENVERWIPVCAAFIIGRHEFENDHELKKFADNY